MPKREDPPTDCRFHIGHEHWALDIAHCTLRRHHHWACRPLSMTPCRTLFFCSLFCPRLTRPSLADPRFRRASERHPRTILRRLQIESNPQSAPPPELSNNGGEPGPRPSCSSASRLSSSRLSPDGPWTGHGRDDVEGPRRSVRLLSR
jgi:hypothetical protein